MKKHLLILLLLALAPGLALRAQPPVVATPVTSLTLPWGLSNLSVVDGRLYACQGGVLVTASMSGRAVTALTPDTTLSRLCPDATYVVRNGSDSLLYFMTSDDDQPYNLNVHTNARFFKNRHVEIKSWFRPIAHPVFSADGNTLIFSTTSGAPSGMASAGPSPSTWAMQSTRRATKSALPSMANTSSIHPTAWPDPTAH